MKFYEMFRNWKDVEEYAPKSVIFSEGDKEDVMFVILSGDVELTLHGEPLGAEGEGGIIGEIKANESSSFIPSTGDNIHV